MTVMTPREWLLALAPSVRNPPAKSDFQPKLAAIELVCRDVPAEAWNDRTLVEAMQQFQFWPSAADVYEVLDADRKARNPDFGVRPYADPAAHVPWGQKPITTLAAPERDLEAEREHVRAQIASLKADLAAQTSEARGDRPAVEARYLDKMTLARSASPEVLATRPDLRAMLDDARQRA